MSAETPYPDWASFQAEYNRLIEIDAMLRRAPENFVLRRMRDEAAARYWKAFASGSNGLDQSFTRAASRNAEMLDSEKTPPEIKELLVKGAIVTGAALLFGAAAGAAAAVAVKEAVLKEAIKGAVGGIVTAAGALATERVIARNVAGGVGRPPRRRRPNLPPPAKATPLQEPDIEPDSEVPPWIFGGREKGLQRDGFEDGKWESSGSDADNRSPDDAPPDTDDGRDRDI